MANEIYKAPHLKSGYTGDEAADRQETRSPVNQNSDEAEENRGQRAPRSGSGAVVGSGAGAGGGGGPEDYDSDPVGGGGALPQPKDDHPKRKGDAPIGGSH